ncbi:phosphoribosyl-AMP cyclohydrolase [Lentisphaerota bacterium WC36G]|nr:phosphoribosyl-AMP cyclohydrolase [Lentisphaerae bacterium WC36]
MSIDLDFNKCELIPVIAQDAETSEILMMAYINKEAWEETLKTNKATYWSRSRNELWRKGESSGHFQEIKEILVDCDLDTVIFKVTQHGGAACHKGYRSCFYRTVNKEQNDLIVTGELVFDPKEVYKK